MEASEFNQIQELTNLCFNTKDYFRNFPQVFKPQNDSFFLTIKELNKIICFCSIYPTYYLYSNTIIKGFCVGSVCTHPNYRGNNLALDILKIAESYARNSQGDFLYLFSTKRSLYEKAGYELCGQTFLAEIKKISKKPNQKKDNIFVALAKDEENETRIIWNFIVKYSKSYESVLSYLEFKDILKIKNMKVFLLWNKEKIAAVCFLNKGDDFNNVIHGIYFSNKEYAIILVRKVYMKESHNKKFYFFPGVFHDDFKNVFTFGVMPTMYAQILNEKLSRSDLEQIYVRSLQGT